MDKISFVPPRRYRQAFEIRETTIELCSPGIRLLHLRQYLPQTEKPGMSIAIRSFPEPSQHHATARGVSVPILEKREAENKHPMDSLLGKFDNTVGKELEKSCITAIQLKLSFAAIHTSAAALIQLLNDLFAMPEHIPFIFEKIESVLAASILFS